MLTQTLFLAAIGLVALVAFVIRQRRVREPLYDLHYAARRTFWVAAVAGMLVFGALMGAMYVGQQYLQDVLGYSTWHAGLSVLPAAVAMVLLAPHSATIVDRFGSRVALLSGYALCGVGFLIMMFLWNASASFTVIAGGYVFLGMGVALAGTPASRALTSSVPVKRAGMASGTADLQRDLGGAVMQSILGALLTAGYAASFRSSIAASPESSGVSDQVVTALTKSFAGAEAVAKQFPQYAPEITDAARESFVAGQHNAFIAGFAAMVLGTLLAFFGFPDRDGEQELLASYATADAAESASTP
jgi:MFS family permease